MQRQDTSLRGVASALRQRNLALFAGGTLCSMSGTWMQRLAVGWVTWELTESTWWLGMVALADLFPTVLCSPVGGVLADRFDRVKLVLATQWASIAITLAILLAAILDLLQPCVLLVFILISGVISGIDHPIRQSLIGDLVRPEQLGAAVFLSVMTFNLARMIGPAMAGPLLLWTGLEGVLIANALSFLTYVWCASRFDLSGAQPRGVSEPQSFLSDITAGLGYVLRRKELLFALAILLSISLLLRPITELLPAFAARMSEHMPGLPPEAVLSAMTATLGVGAFLGVLMAPGLSYRLGSRGATWVTACACAAMMVAFLAVQHPLMSLVVLGGFGCALLANSVLVQTSVHQNSEPDFRGRALSLQSVIFRGAPALGALATGWIAEKLGLTATGNMAALIWVAAAAAVFWWLRHGQ